METVAKDTAPRAPRVDDDAAGGAIGRSLPNARWDRLVRGRGRFVANTRHPDLLHAAFARAAEAHGLIEAVDIDAARAAPGVVAVFTAADLAEVCAPWQPLHGLFPEARVPHERPLAEGAVRYVGEPVAIVVAETAAAARDAAELVEITLRSLDPVVTAADALAPEAPALHPDLAGGGGNLHARIAREAKAAPAAETHTVTLTLARVAPQPMETRALLAEYDPAEGTLVVRQSHQHPHQQQDVFARLLGIPEHKVQVICEDVGGAFGLKQQLHKDEMAAVCAAVRLGRAVRFVATRSESLLSDGQARDHALTGRIELDADGRITALCVADVCGVGAFTLYPRSSFGESGQMTRLVGAPYAVPAVAFEATLAFQNRPPLGHYRGVGHPVACLITEALMDAGARARGEDPIAFRRRHLHDLSAGSVTTPGGIVVAHYRMAECLDAIADRLADRTAPADGRLRGVGVACLLELTANGPRYYGDGDIHIACTETVILRMEPSGVVRLATGHTDQGQGGDQMLAQVVAAHLGIAATDVAVTSGDSANAPYGGGAFGSRGTAVSGQAARDAATQLAARLLATAALLNQREAGDLRLEAGHVTAGGERLMALAELASLCHFKSHLLPAGHEAGLTVVGRHVPAPDTMNASAAFAAAVAIDPDTGTVEVERLIAAHEAGTVVNPMSVDAQLAGGAAQGLGQALTEAIRMDAAGQPLTGSFMDYAMPRADMVPPVEVVHIPPRAEEGFLPRGVGEAGASGAPAAILGAINNALAPMGALITELPATPLAVWNALQAAREGRAS
ncbi:xanthine dehydrogenase family protein molybdopterin-binding subunit [Acuticoccus sp. I52.16.1]|uniref:xanthine dehydrogenase family protein molybdopterin-binding subunit n=1 Tax=Acuticoccus sp. I52.16.1 TaxID=2928472 RepID=UPI001FD122BA|nr:xanthine dehydrogenase family protein molybdopterin-binding subunit [Acuticoccus sp. I52.16.1]UOM33939.1 xanthine dehydrogenase family protein molybdopterin-binding subunit [Acuticoccus sp. I52.16.1]